MTVRRFLNWQFKVEAGVTTVAYAAVALSLLGDIVGREFFGHGIWGAQRFAVYAAIIAGFLGMALAAAENGHIRPQFLDFLIPAEFENAINRVADFVSALLYFGLTFLSVNFVYETFLNADTAPVLDWPLWPIQTILPYTFLSVSLRYLLQSIDPVLKTSPDGIEEEL